MSSFASLLNSTPLWRAATVVRNGGHVFDVRDLQSTGIQRADSRFASGPRTHHANLDMFQTMLLRRGAGLLRRDLRSKGRALARTPEAATARGRPRQRVALTIGDGDDRVVEG